MAVDVDRLKPAAKVRFPGRTDIVTLVAVTPGPFWEFFFDSPSGPGKHVLAEAELDAIEIADAPTELRFDGDPMQFRLGVEARRIDIAFAYEMAAVAVSNIQPLRSSMTLSTWRSPRSRSRPRWHSPLDGVVQLWARDATTHADLRTGARRCRSGRAGEILRTTAGMNDGRMRGPTTRTPRVNFLRANREFPEVAGHPSIAYWRLLSGRANPGEAESVL